MSVITILGDEDFQRRGVALKHVRAKRFNVKRDGGLDVAEGFFVRVALADDNAFQPERIGHVPIDVLLNNDLERFSPSL